MVDRVALTSQYLKVSFPEVEVLTAGPGQLLFDSSATQLKKLFSGRITLPSWDYTGVFTDDGGVIDIMFPGGLTLPYPPFAMFSSSLRNGMDSTPAIHNIPSPPGFDNYAPQLTLSEWSVVRTNDAPPSSKQSFNITCLTDRVRLTYYSKREDRDASTWYYYVFENAT